MGEYIIGIIDNSEGYSFGGLLLLPVLKVLNKLIILCIFSYKSVCLYYVLLNWIYHENDSEK